jgi:hypothetical protein
MFTEKDLPVIPDIDLVEPTDALKVEEQKASALQYFCIGWTVMLPGIMAAIENIKWFWWKWAAQTGVAIVNQIHGKICPVIPPQS